MNGPCFGARAVEGPNGCACLCANGAPSCPRPPVGATNAWSAELGQDISRHTPAFGLLDRLFAQVAGEIILPHTVQNSRGTAERHIANFAMG